MLSAWLKVGPAGTEEWNLEKVYIYRHAREACVYKAIMPYVKPMYLAQIDGSVRVINYYVAEPLIIDFRNFQQRMNTHLMGARDYHNTMLWVEKGSICLQVFSSFYTCVQFFTSFSIYPTAFEVPINIRPFIEGIRDSAPIDPG